MCFLLLHLKSCNDGLICTSCSSWPPSGLNGSLVLLMAQRRDVELQSEAARDFLHQMNQGDSERIGPHVLSLFIWRECKTHPRCCSRKVAKKQSSSSSSSFPGTDPWRNNRPKRSQSNHRGHLHRRIIQWLSCKLTLLPVSVRLASGLLLPSAVDPLNSC